MMASSGSGRPTGSSGDLSSVSFSKKSRITLVGDSGPVDVSVSSFSSLLVFCFSPSLVSAFEYFSFSSCCLFDNWLSAVGGVSSGLISGSISGLFLLLLLVPLVLLVAAVSRVTTSNSLHVFGRAAGGTVSESHRMGGGGGVLRVEGGGELRVEGRGGLCVEGHRGHA